MKVAWPIRWCLYLLVVATATPLCLYIGVGLLDQAEDAQSEAEQLVLSLASTAAATARGRLQETEFIARALAMRPLVRAVDPARCDPVLEGLLPLLPHYANISVIAPDGRFVCSALPVASAGQSVPLHEGIKGALKGRFSVSAPMMGVLPPRFLVSTGYPIVDEAGSVRGVLTIPIDLAAFQPVNDPLALPRNARVRVVDSRGVLLASSAPNDPELGRDLRGKAIVERVLSADTGAGREQGSDGRLSIYGYAAVGSNGWRAYAVVPADELLAAARRRTRASALVVAGLLVIALTAAALVSRRIAGAAASMQRAMDETAAGRVAYAAEEGPRELRSLAANYNRMLEAMLEAREALHQSEARLRLAVRGSQTGLWDWDVATDVVYLSPEWKRQLGYEDHEIGTRLDEWIERLHPDERDRILREQRFLGASGGSHYEAEFRLRHKDGSYRWIYSRAELMRTSDGAPLRMVGTHVDITPRKSLEQRLEQTIEALREQSMRMIDVGEAERRSISRELHDRTGANIAALQITLRLLGDKLNDGDSEAAAALAEDAREVLSDMSSEIRNIMSELRPAALDDFGLYPALLSYARHVASRLNIEVKWAGGTVEPRPPGAIETALFRIAQEALTNAAKHARATLLEIALERRDGVLVLEVADNGVGFDAADHARGHGMRTMRERADAIRGTIRVSSAPGAGTRVTVEVPLP